jgi:hypothetical protein
MSGQGPVVLAWVLTAVFALLALPCVLRLTRLDYVRLGPTVRHGDLAELLLVVAMVAMFSPVGGPIPAAGWQAVLALTTAWFGVTWWRGRRVGHSTPCGHHGVSAAAMLFMVTAMPHSAGAHGPWLTMSSTVSPMGPWLSAVAIAIAAYFVADAVHSGIQAARGGVSDQVSRWACRMIMGGGMGYMFLSSAL